MTLETHSTNNFRNVLATTFVILVVAYFNSCWAGTFTTDNRDAEKCYYTGPITRPDSEKMTSILKNGCRVLYVSSNGGEVDAAINMGAEIRKKKATVIIIGHGACKSACVFLYAGAVDRLPYGPVEIHRPYLKESEVDFASTQKLFKKLERKAKVFLSSVNVNPSLYDQMMLVAPQDSRPLTLSEMEDMGMGFRDPVYQEYIDNIKATRAGIPKKTFLQLKLSTREICGDIDGVLPEGKAEQIINCWETKLPQYMIPLRQLR